MIATKLRTTSVLLASLFTISCANLQQSTSGNAKPEASKAYLAGSFLNSHRESFARLALEVKCKSETRALHIELNQPENYHGLELCAVEPGECQMEGLGLMGGVGDLADVAPFSNQEMSKSFVVKAGTVYYLGHYDGMSTYDTSSAETFGGFAWVSGGISRAVKVSRWDTAKIENAINSTYPSFSELEVVGVFNTSQHGQR